MISESQAPNLRKQILEKRLELPINIGALSFSHVYGGYTFFPVTKLVCTFFNFGPIRYYTNLSWGGKKDKKGGIVDRSALFFEAPAIYDSGRVYFGGPDWFYKKTSENIREYTKNKEDAYPVGVIRDFRQDRTRASNALNFERSKQDRHRVERVHNMLENDVMPRPGCYRIVKLGDSEITLPQFFSAPTPRFKLRLREGSELDDCVLEHARRGDWNIDAGFMTATTRGVVKGLADGQLEFSHKLSDGEKAEDITASAGVRVEGGNMIEKIASPFAELEALIQNVFGVTVAVNMRSIVGASQQISVREGQTLFLPIGKREWTMEELRQSPDFESLKYLAALCNARHHNGVEFYDFSFAYSPKVSPWVDLSGVEVQPIEFLESVIVTDEKTKKKKKKWRYNPKSIMKSSPTVLLDMANLAIGVERAKSVSERQLKPKAVEEAVVAAIAKDALPIQDDALYETIKNSGPKPAETLDDNTYEEDVVPVTQTPLPAALSADSNN